MPQNTGNRKTPAQKLLTISVAAYNGAATLDAALSSMLVQNLDLLEVIVVDDGSSDDTAQIAARYTVLYPTVFKLIRQQNGGYGTTITAALAEAQGRYFRTVDCDDTCETAALDNLLDFLTGCQTDVVVTDYCTVSQGKTLAVHEASAGKAPGQGYQLQTMAALCFEMHALSFATEVLRSANMQLPAHCLYTDMAYTFYGIAAAKTVSFCPGIVYRYTVGQQGQSVSLASYAAHMADFATVTELVLAQTKQPAVCQAAEGKRLLLQNRAVAIAQEQLLILLRLPVCKENKTKLMGADALLRREYPTVYRAIRQKSIRLLRLCGYLCYGPLARREAARDAGK